MDGGPFSTITQIISPGGNSVHAHGETNGVTTRGADIPISSTNDYYFTYFRNDTEGFARLRLYTPTTFQLVGESTTEISTNGGFFRFRIQSGYIGYYDSGYAEFGGIHLRYGTNLTDTITISNSETPAAGA